jgi:ERCC4-related helicase
MPYQYIKNITPREYQKKIFETCTKKNCLIVLPTGLGKTLISLMISIERLKKYPLEKIVFLAPTKPLAEQHIKTFKDNLPDLFADIQLFTGKIKAEKRKKIWDSSNIIFSTPQCVANDLRKKLYDLKDICLLIEDEAHRCVKNYDYNYIAKEYKKQAEHQRIIGMTASPGNDISKIKTICTNLSIQEIELRTRESEDVKEYLQKLEFEKISLDFPSELLEIKKILEKLFESYIEELRKRKVLFKNPTKIELLELQKRISSTISRNYTNFNYLLAASACAQAIKIQHSIELLETQTLESFNNYLKKLLNQALKKQSKGIEKLVNKPEFNFVYSRTNELLEKKFEHPKIEKIKEIVKKELKNKKNPKIIIFTQYRDTAEIITKELKKELNIKSKIFVGQSKRISSSGKEIKGLNQKEQGEILKEFSEGKINVLCATQIAEEGLDIPEVNLVIFYEPISSAIRAIQRAGRTARLKKGKLIILITKKTRDEIYFYVSKSRERKMKEAIEIIKDKLNNEKKFEKQEKL